MGNNAYGLEPGMRGTHSLFGDAELEVVHADFLDQNRALYRYYGGPRSGKEFAATAEHFDEAPKNQRCPECGARVYSVFDHIDLDECPEID